MRLNQLLLLVLMVFYEVPNAVHYPGVEVGSHHWWTLSVLLECQSGSQKVEATAVDGTGRDWRIYNLGDSSQSKYWVICANKLWVQGCWTALKYYSRFDHSESENWELVLMGITQQCRNGLQPPRKMNWGFWNTQGRPWYPDCFRVDLRWILVNNFDSC